MRAVKTFTLCFLGAPEPWTTKDKRDGEKEMHFSFIIISDLALETTDCPLYCSLCLYTGNYCEESRVGGAVKSNV